MPDSMTEKTPKKLFIQTYGCQMNEYDSSRIRDLLGDSHALVQTDNAAEADVLLLNTCSVRERAQEKVFHQLGRWKRLKKKNPDLIIGVGGCVASQEGAQIAKRAHHEGLSLRDAAIASGQQGDSPVDVAVVVGQFQQHAVGLAAVGVGCRCTAAQGRDARAVGVPGGLVERVGHGVQRE